MRWILLLLLMSTVVSAHSEHEPHSSAEVGQALVEANISCSLMDNNDILAVGTYLYGDHRFSWWTRLKTRIAYCRTV